MSRLDGPFDLSELDNIADSENYLDLGVLLAPNVADLEIHVDIDGETGLATSARLVIGPSSAQIQVYAAPRDSDLWPDIRIEIEGSLTSQGIPVTREYGRFGPELHAMLPTTDLNGRSFLRAVRFIGVDGNRWFIRGVITGDAAVDDLARQHMDSVIASLIIVRGDEPMAPGEPLQIKLPD